ncbi:hypothetical protein [Methylotuvimicrobium buryatense]|uniref:Uncharacterized protein n=1 Tax=Methylotuvimicrobium buryatense TaxID=95641 RepID=A0A4P9UUW2_METBY|nr:hypothetical protein [Methylotuvimicrobium buryatense]QCW84403.1 hypothetical protein EQU24_20825 [Methylotuvimicrobium buryatense]
MFKFLIAAASVIFISIANVSANNKLNDCYIVTGGTAKSNSIPYDLADSYYIPGSEQIGEYEISLVNARLPKNPKLAIKISGPFKGKIIAPDFPFIKLNHVLSSSDQAGLIFTKDDEVTSAFFETETVLLVEETLKPIAGTGKFENLKPYPESKINVSGSLDLATGKNNFNIVSGTLCF